MHDDLKDRFDELREHEQRRAPEFQQLLMRPARTRGNLGSIPLITAAGVAAVCVLMAWPRHIEVGTGPLTNADQGGRTDSVVRVIRAPDLMRELPDLHESILNMQGSP